MPEGDEEVRREALSLVAGLLAADSAREHEEAVGYALMCTYPGDNAPTLYGLIADPVEALRIAERFTEELNKGNVDEEPYVVTVHPVLPPPEYEES